MLYCFSPEEKLTYTCLPTLIEAQKIIPSIDNPGPFNLTLSWSPSNIPGLNYAVMFWVNNIPTCYGLFNSMGKYLLTDDVKVILGKSVTPFDKESSLPYAAYARFKNLNIYKRAISVPDIDVDSDLLIPENLLELSTDGVSWKSFINGDLPLFYGSVDGGDARTVYMRNKRPQKNIKKLHKRETAYLITRWEITS